MNQLSSFVPQEQKEFSTLGISCTENRFVPLLSIPIKEYAANLRATIQQLELTPDDRLLILRTANIHLMEAVLSLLFDTIPEIGVDLVTQQVFLPYIRHPQVNAVLISDDQISSESLGKALAQHSLKEYRMVLVPYSNTHGNGYENVILAVRSIFSGKVHGIGSNGCLRIVYRYPRIAWAMRKPLRIAAFFLMLILITGMALWFKGWLPVKRRLKRICNPK